MIVKLRTGQTINRGISERTRKQFTSWKPLFKFRNKKLGAQVGLDRFFIAKSSAHKAFESLAGESGVESANKVGNVHLTVIPNDPKFYQQWHLQNNGPSNGGAGSVPGADIKATQAWNITTGSSNVTIAIVDTGVDLVHPDLAPNIWENSNEIPGNMLDDDNNGYVDDTKGWNFVASEANPQGTNNAQDDFGHGTSCAGIASAVGNNGLVVTGVCWNCKIMPIKVFDSSGNGSDYWLGQGIIYAVDNGADIISLSAVLDEDSPSVHSAVLYAIQSNVVVCAAMGNDWSGRIRYPAAMPDVIAVGATNNNDTRASFSNWGSHIDVVAPGYGITTTRAGEMLFTNSFTGTSASTPMVAGICGLLRSYAPSISVYQVNNLICQGADDIDAPGFDNNTGYGRANAYVSLLGIQDPTPPSQPFVSVPSPYTSDGSSLSFSWTTSIDAETAIMGYEYAVGTLGNPLALRNWTSVGNVTEAVASGLILQAGTPYQISVRAKNGAHAPSSPGVSTPVIYAPLVDSIGATRQLADHSYLTLSERTVTANFGDRVWITDLNRAGTIAVTGSFSAGEGEVVTVNGRLDTSACYSTLQAAQLKVIRSGPDPKSVAILGASVGGENLNGNLMGITNGTGLYNIGQLVKVWGKVISVGPGFIIIDDASGSVPPNTFTGLKIDTDGYAQPLLDTYVTAIGIVECENSSGDVIPVIKIRKEADLKPVDAN